YASPATYTWTATAVSPGAKTVVATNGAGTTASAAITISADSTAPAAFSLSAPVAAAEVRTGVALTSAPTDAQSGIGSVSYYYCPGTTCTVATGTLIGTDTSSPYSVTWNNALNGDYTLIARATD